MNPAVEQLIGALAKVSVPVALVLLLTAIGLFNPVIPDTWTKGQVWDIVRWILAAGGAAVASLWSLASKGRKAVRLIVALLVFYSSLQGYGWFIITPPPHGLGYAYDLGAMGTFLLAYVFFGLCVGEIIDFVQREYLQKKQPASAG